MPFDFERASGFALIPAHNPSYLPPPFVMSYAPGASFTFRAAGGYDAVRSQNVGADFPRGLVSPTRAHAADYLLDSFDGYPLGSFTGTSGGWVNSNSGTGQAYIIGVSGGDPAVDGNTIDMHSGSQVGSRTGFTRQLGAMGDNFSYFAMPRFMTPSADPNNAFYVWMQNNAGVTLQTRFYNGTVEIFANGAYQYVCSFGGNFFAEAWCCAVKKPSGLYDMQFYAGTKLFGGLYGVAPATNQMANNTIAFGQLGLASAYQRAQLAQINAGPTQLPDDLNLCGPTVVPKFSPSVGYLYALVENVSNSILTPGNLKLFITKDDGTTWTEVPWTNYGEWAKGVMDNTMPILKIAGTVALPNNGGMNIRYGIRSYNGCMPVVHGVVIFWDP